MCGCKFNETTALSPNFILLAAALIAQRTDGIGGAGLLYNSRDRKREKERERELESAANNPAK